MGLLKRWIQGPFSVQNPLPGPALLNLESNLPLNPVDIPSMDSDLRWCMEKRKAKVANVGSSLSYHGCTCHCPKLEIIIEKPDQRTAIGLKRSCNLSGLIQTPQKMSNTTPKNPRYMFVLHTISKFR